MRIDIDCPAWATTSADMVIFGDGERVLSYNLSPQEKAKIGHGVSDGKESVVPGRTLRVSLTRAELEGYNNANPNT